MPFPLPEEPDVEAFTYFLVAIPDAPEYRQAAKGAFTDLGRASAWGPEGITSGSFVAAQVWLRAIAETWRLLEMGWPDLVLGYIDDIETLLTALQNTQSFQLTCCNDNYTFESPPGGGSSSDPVPQPIIDAGYATGTSDYPGYSAYKCMAAHLLLNNLQEKLVNLSPLVTLGGGLLSLLLVLFGAVSGITGVVLLGAVVGIPEILQLIDALKDLGSVSLEDLAEDLESNRTEIVCAIVGGDGIDDMIAQFDAVVNSLYSFPANVIIRSLNVRHMMQLLMYGEHGNANIADALAAAGYDPANYTCCDFEDEWDIVGVQGNGQETGSITVNTDTYTADMAETELASTAANCGTLGNRVLIAQLLPVSGTPIVGDIRMTVRVQATVARTNCASSYTAKVYADFSSDAGSGCITPNGANEQELDSIEVAGYGGIDLDETYVVNWNDVNLGTRGCVWLKAELHNYNFTSQDVTITISSVWIR